MLNGLSVDAVERRCRPCPDKTAFSDWRFASSKGFLADDETLAQVVQHDANALELLHQTREAVGERLKRLALCLKQTRVAEDGFSSVIFEGVALEARKSWFVSPQYSPFFNDAVPGSLDNVSWAVEWKLRNPRTGVCFVLSGDEAGGIAHLIGRFGFFEGGLDGSNRYRIDPHVLHCCLGDRAPDVHVRAYADARRRHHDAKRQRVLAGLDGAAAAEQRSHATSAVARLDAKIAELDRWC